MKYALYCLLLILIVPPVLAQSTAAQSQKTWIFLTDKLIAPNKTTVVEEGYISERAVWRRTLRGNQPDVEQDAPVSPVYIQGLEEIGITIINQSRWLNAVTAHLDSHQAEAVKALPFVHTIRKVARLSAPSTPLVEAPIFPSVLASNCANGAIQAIYGNSCRQLEIVNAITSLQWGFNGTGVNLGFLDTRFDPGGIPFNHTAFDHIRTDNRFTVKDFTEENQNDYGGNQGSFHGLRVASVAAGYDIGYLIGPGYGATLFAAVTEFAPFERNVEEDNFVAGVEWMESQGVDVINSSLGYSQFDPGQHSYTPDEMDGDTAITTRICDKAAALGIVVVTSAGNEGGNSWGIITSPADGDSVIAVGGVTPSRSRASFSSRGPTADGRIKPDVSAMGTDVVVVASTDPRFYTWSSGTSFSSPMVAGVVAQILQVHPTLDPISVRDILTSTASNVQNPDNLLGWGIINASAAIEKAEEIKSSTEELPERFPTIEVQSTYPNPFRDNVRFDVQVPHVASNVQLKIYNVLGQHIDTIFAGTLQPGIHEIAYNNVSLSSGLYLYVLESDHSMATGKITLAR